MVRFLKPATMAAVAACATHTLGAFGQVGKNSIPIALAASPPSIELRDRSSRRGGSFVEFGAAPLWEGSVVHKYANEDDRLATQGWKSVGGIRFTIINTTPEPLWVWIETTRGATYWVKDPDAPWGLFNKIKIQAGESIQISNLPQHSGTVRAYARCNEEGTACAGDEGTATKWEWTTSPQNNGSHIVGLNPSLGTQIPPS
jgi:hypothetical protein